MKKFMKKVFFWDDPTAGAVFSWILSFVSTFCFSNFHLLNRFFSQSPKEIGFSTLQLYLLR